MSMLIAAFMFVALLAASIANFIWTLGSTWPIRARNTKLLAQTVIGTPGVEHMPPRTALFGTATGMLIAGVTALALADHDSGGVPLVLLGLAIAAIFLVRGVIGYTSWWAQQRPEPNFRLNDRRVYSPLCLAVGAGFLVLVLLRLL